MNYAAVLAVLPEYRRSFVDVVVENLSEGERGEGLHWIVGDSHLDPTISSGSFDDLDQVRNRHLLGRRLLWQSGALSRARHASVLVVDLNPRSLTAWALLAIRRASRRRVLVWGHINPRAGVASSTAPLRRAMRRLADGVISYTWDDADQVRAEDGHSRVWVAANGLYRSSEIWVDVDSVRSRILYVGRLEHAKRPLLLLEAFELAIPKLPETVMLTYVGDGALRAELERRCTSGPLSGRVQILGHVSAVEDLRQIYRSAIVSVSPGYVGLSLTQSLGFGVPMLVADDEPHSPEFELLTPQTGGLFPARNAPALASAIVDVVEGRLRWDSNSAVEAVRDLYSSDAMAHGFVAALRNEDQEQP